MKAIDELRVITEKQKTVSVSVLARLIKKMENEYVIPNDWSTEPFKKGKTYLNNTEKIDYYKLISFNEFIQNYADAGEKYNWSKEVTERLRVAGRLIDQAVNQVMNSVDKGFRRKLIAEAAKYSIVTTYSSDARREYRKMQELDSIAPVDRELFNEALLQMDTKLCMDCPVEIGKYQGCNIYKLFVDQDIDVIQDSPAEGVCPFSRIKLTVAG